MFLYESWANRMLPQFHFDEIVDRLEVIGSTREIHGAMQRMRAGTWPIAALTAEFVTEKDDTSDDDDVVAPVYLLLNKPFQIEELLVSTSKNFKELHTLRPSSVPLKPNILSRLRVDMIIYQ